MSNLIASDAEILSENSRGFGQNRILRDYDGKFYAVYLTTSGNVKVVSSIDSGSTWSTEIEYSPTIESGVNNSIFSKFSLAKNSNNDIFLSYVEGEIATGIYTIKAKKRTYLSGGLGNWSEVYSLTEDEQTTKTDSSGRVCAIIHCNTSASAKDRLHIVWGVYDASTITPRHAGIKNVYSTDGGNNWSSENYLNDTTTNTTPRIFSVDNYSDGRFLVFSTVKTTLTNSRIFNSDGTYNTTSLSAIFYYGASGLIDKNDDYWVIGLGANSVARRITIYSTATTNITLSGDTGRYGMVSIGCDKDNNIYVFYVRTDNKLYYMKYNYKSRVWVPQTAINTSDKKIPSCEQHSLSDSFKLITSYFIDDVE